MAILVGAPTPTPTLPVSSRSRIKHVWTGWNGEQFDLNNYEGTSGVVLMPDVTGLLMPDFTMYTDKAPGIDGERWRGYGVESRDVVWGVFVYQDTSSEAWVDHDRRWWRSLRPDRPGVWSVTAPGATERQIRLRLKSVEPVYPRDPAYAQWAVYAIHLWADDPYWLAPATSPMFEDDVEVNWLGGGPVDEYGAATPMVFGPNSTARTASIANQGDVASWIQWEAHGPLDAGTVLGVAGRSVVIDQAIPAGSVVSVDTDPSDQRILMDGLEVIPSTAPQFAPVPDGGRVSLDVRINGTGYVRATLRPRYFKAW